MIKSNTVILIYPRLEEGGQTKKAPPPLSLLSLSASLKERGKEVRLYDLRNYDNYETLLRSISEPPVCFGISAMISYQIRDGAIFSETARKIFPEVPIVWGGWFPSVLPNVVMTNPAVDIVVRGQGEVTFAEVVEALSTHGNLAEIKGITYKKSNGVFANPPREPVDLNSLPPVDYSIVDIAGSTLSDGYVNYVSSSGCPYRCKFCDVQIVFGRKWMPISAARIVNDIETLVKNYKIKMVDFFDDNFFVNRQRILEIMNGFISRNINIQWIANCRVNQFLQLNEEDIRLIRRAGCHTLTFGAESGNQKTLDFLQKDIKIEEIEEVAKRLHNHNITVRYNFLVGIPNETPDDFQQTLKFILKLKDIHPNLEVVFYFYMPVPESKLKEEDIKMGFKPPNTFEGWSRFGFGNITQPWIFRVDKSVMEDNREEFKCMSFYFWKGYLSHDTTGSFPKRFIRKIIKVISRFRVQTGFYTFPVEWKRFYRINEK